ncbi:MAG: ubiquitin-like small modifier protein 1 [Ktedonobacterales bacterium]
MQLGAEEHQVRVSLPAMLAERTGNRRTTVAQGRTVREVISTLDEQFPGIRFNLCLETGNLRPFVNIFLNGENIRYLRGLDTTISSDATLHILPSVAGG